MNSLREGPRKSSGNVLETVFGRVLGKVLETDLGSLRKNLWDSPGECLETG